MARNERTSKRVAAIAARLLALKVRPRSAFHVLDRDAGQYQQVAWADVRALAASYLTQTADKPARPPQPGRKTCRRRKFKI